MTKKNGNGTEEPLEKQLWKAEPEEQLKEEEQLNKVIAENLAKIKLNDEK